LRRIGACLAARFRIAHAGSWRPALTLEDGTLAVTDNYLKVRIPPGHARNERISVLITHEGQAGGTVAGRGSEKAACGN
jgi:hypothetical protein